MRRGFLTVVVLAVVAATAQAAAPSNDDRSGAIAIEPPASVRGTTAEATVEEGEAGSSCADSRGSVWYEIRPGAARRLALRLNAAGDLDAVLDVYSRQRSQLTPVRCDSTDGDGEAAIAFQAQAGATYLVRVAKRTGSVDGSFRLDLFAPQPPAQPPGRRLPPRGITRSLDRLGNTDDAWSRRLRAGRSYRVNLATGGRCMRLRVFGPGARSFDGGFLRQASCGGYLLYTPGPGEGGLHKLLVEADTRARGRQRYHLEMAPAGRDDSIPGRVLGRRVRGSLNGSRADVVDLYRFDVLRRSNVSLRLRASGGDFDLVLLRQSGRRLECACGASGNETASRRLRPGRYYAAVRAAGGSAGGYRLGRSVRTITSTGIAIDGTRRARSAPGRTVSIRARVRPSTTGRVTIFVERFDPLFGWQFARRYRTRAARGTAAVRFRPRAEGRYRARAFFRGSSSAAASRSGYARLLVAGPLRP